MPSPVATAGLVVSRKTWPAPPVASSVAARAHLAARAVGVEVARRRAPPVLDDHVGDERVIDRLDRRQRARPAPTARGRSRGRSRRRRAARGGRCAPPRGRAPAGRRRRDRSARPTRAARARSAGPPRRARATAASSHRPSPARSVSAACSAGRVVVADRGGDAALRVAGVALGRVGLGEDRGRGPPAPDAIAARRPGDAAADDQEICVGVHADVILPSPRMPMDPVRIDVATPSRALRRHASATALLDRARRDCSTRSARRRAASSSRARWSGGCTAPQLARAAGGAEPILVPDGERYKQLATVVAHLRRAGPRQRRSRVDDHHVRRRRHRRHGRLRRGDLPARHRARPRADDAAGAGRQRDRRQGRRQSSRSART